MTETRPTVYVYDNPAETLNLACLLPNHGEEEDAEIVAEYGRNWLATADQIGARYNVIIEALVTRDAAEGHDWNERNAPADVDDDEYDIIDEVWQAMHDAADLPAQCVR